MAVDTSALIAILWDEPDATDIRAKLAASEGAVISTASLLELQHVLTRTKSLQGWSAVSALMTAYSVAVWPFDENQLTIARTAVLNFGRGRHKASLNFGDCFSYALAKSEGLKLLCKGDGFRHTDIEIA